MTNQESKAIKHIPTHWLIYFDDADHKPEIFTSEQSARHRYKIISVSWNAHLFAQVNSNSRDATSLDDLEYHFRLYAAAHTQALAAIGLKGRVEELERDVAKKESDRQYHMNAINKLARFLAFHGTSDDVIEAAMDNMKQFSRELTLERTARLHIAGDSQTHLNRALAAEELKRHYVTRTLAAERELAEWKEKFERVNGSYKGAKQRRMSAEENVAKLRAELEAWKRPCQDVEKVVRRDEIGFDHSGEWEPDTRQTVYWVPADFARRLAAQLRTAQEERDKAVAEAATWRQRAILHQRQRYTNSGTKHRAVCQGRSPASSTNWIAWCNCGWTKVADTFYEAEYLAVDHNLERAQG